VIRPARNQWDNTGEVRTMKSAQLAVCCCIFLGIAIFTGSYARSSQSITPARAATVDQEVHQLMRSVAHDVTEQGPLAWLKYFEAGSSFFMVVDGQMAFADGTAAREGTQSFSRTIQHIELQWGDLRIDPLTSEFAVVGAPWREITVDNTGHRKEDLGFFTALAEFRDGRWQLRNAHWSSPAAPSPSH
jgi:hypothetical protein